MNSFSRYFITILLALMSAAFTMDKPAYRLFDKNAKATDYAALLRAAREADVVLFGELHNNPICHWLQIELTQDLHSERKNALVLGAEMFEADNQLILNEYAQGLITEKHLKDEAKVWDNYATDYKPILDFAVKNQIPMIATNIPRRYASLVSKRGLAALDVVTAEAKNYIAPLPIAFDASLPAYANMVKMMGGHGGGGNPENFAAAQAVKDATMAHFILKNWAKGKTFLHFNGAYHSDNFESIVWYLRRAKPELRILTISSVEQAKIDELSADNRGKADFTIAIPQNMTKTY